ncbi:MAG: tRNA lysidine(34) synthetase TilS [Bacteroidota bacterium]
MIPTSSIVQKFIQQHNLISKRDQILVAISGGPDSVFLVYCLKELGYSLALAHVNYQLRGEASELDQALVQRLSKQCDIPLHLLKADPKTYAIDHQVSLQVACRDIRYAFFGELLQQYAYSCCATAHHLDDQIETILMSFMKGNSPAVFKGIPVRRGFYIRPLLCLQKEEILTYLTSNHLSYRIDQSNLESKYLRNQIRHSIIPALEDIQPSAVSQIRERFSWYQTQQLVLKRLLESFAINAITEQAFSKHIQLSEIQKALGAEAAVLLLAHVLDTWGIHGYDIWRVVDLLNSPSGKQVSVDNGQFIRDRHGISFLKDRAVPSPIQIAELIPSEQQTIHWQGNVLSFSFSSSFPDNFGEHGIYFLDKALLQGQLLLRNWQEGDRMIPLGMKRQKKLSDIFVDEKYSPVAKRNAWVLCDDTGIVCLGGFRISDRVRLSSRSKHILMIREKAIQTGNNNEQSQ